MTQNAIIYRRFSSDEQEDGDSFRRQQEVCEAFARTRGWTIIERVDDPGRSAFKNEHMEFGELGRLTRRIEARQVARGTILLAEKMDRFSRRHFREVNAWFDKVVTSGVRIAVADVSTVYDENSDLGDEIARLVRADQSHQESKKKSDRVLDAKRDLWEKAERREDKWTNLAARVPLWLTRNAQRNGWLGASGCAVEDEPRVAIIRDVYQWSADGLGAVMIARRLNERGEKPWGHWRKQPGWGRTAILQLLSNPAVEGDFVPETGIFVGRVLPGFYPRVVDADLVARARASQRSRKKAAGNRVSTGTANLFSGLTTCVFCLKRMFMSSSVSKGRRYQYLRCEAAGEGRCTNTAYFPYEAFEKTALDFCLDLALEDRFFEATGELQQARIKHAELEKAIETKRTQRGRLLAFLAEGDDQVAAMVHTLKAEVDGLVASLAEAHADVERASGKVGAVEHLRRVNDIREAANSADAAVREHARAKLKLAFTAFLTTVLVGTTRDGVKVFTVVAMGGALGIRIDAQGKVLGHVVAGKEAAAIRWTRKRGGKVSTGESMAG